MTFHTLGMLASGLTVVFLMVGMAQTEMTSNQQFVIKMLEAVVPGLGVVAVAVVGAWFARASNNNSKAAVVKATEAVDKTDRLTEKTAEMSDRLDGRLEEVLKLVEEAALLKGAEQERTRADAQKVTDTATARADAKEDRAEGRDAMVPQPGTPVIPVETRTEAAAEAPKKPRVRPKKV